MATMGETQVWEPVTPTGTALALLIVTCIFSVLIMIVLPLRFFIRMYTRCLGFEDWLMFAGFVSIYPAPNPFSTSSTSENSGTWYFINSSFSVFWLEKGTTSNDWRSYLGRCTHPKWFYHIRLLHRHWITRLKDQCPPNDPVRFGYSLLANDIRNKHSTNQMLHLVDFDQADNTKQIPLPTLHTIRHLSRRWYRLILRCVASL